MENLKKLINELYTLSSQNKPSDSIKDDINEAFIVLFQTKINDDIVAGIIKIPNKSGKGLINNVIRGTLETISPKICIKHKVKGVEIISEATNVVKQLFKFNDWIVNNLNNKEGKIIDVLFKLKPESNYQKIHKEYKVQYFDSFDEIVSEKNLTDLLKIYKVGDYVVIGYEDKKEKDEDKKRKYTTGRITEVKNDDNYKIQYGTIKSDGKFNTGIIKKNAIILKCRYKIGQEVEYTGYSGGPLQTGVIDTISYNGIRQIIFYNIINNSKKKDKDSIDEKFITNFR